MEVWKPPLVNIPEYDYDVPALAYTKVFSITFVFWLSWILCTKQQNSLK